MSRRTTVRDVAVGLLVIAALVGLLGLMRLASDGPGFLAPQKTIDVVFRDGQGIRVGSPVRVAGLDAGNVVDLDLVEVEGTLRARVRISLPVHLVKKLRQDVKISITPGPDRHEPRERGGDGPVGRRPGARAVDRGSGELVLRPDHRAGRAWPGRAQPPEPHDRRGPSRPSIRSGPGCGRC